MMIDSEVHVMLVLSCTEAASTVTHTQTHTNTHKAPAKLTIFI
jgi:hypothetical protein